MNINEKLAALEKSIERVAVFCVVIDCQDHEIRFYPVKMVGFSHRVVIDNHAVDWLGDTHSVSKKSAAYFAVKHLLNGGQSF